MKAAVYSKTKSGKVLEIIDIEAPVAKRKQVLIKVYAASVNPLDWRLKSQRPGVDVAGDIAAVGQRVTRFKPGDAVFGTCRGAFAEYACASEDALVPKPDNLTYEQAAAMPIAGLTALQALTDKGHLQAGQRVLINGAAGGVGTFAVQIAKALGGDVTGVCSTRNVEMVRQLGADRVIDYTQQDFTREGQRYDLLLDNVGNRELSALRRAMTAHGRCVLAGAPKELWAVTLRVIQALAWPPFLPQKFTFFIAKVTKNHLESLCKLMKTGNLTPVIEKSYRLSELAQAIAYVEQGHARAKQVVSLK